MTEAYHILYKPTNGNAFGTGRPIKTSYDIRAVADSEGREAAAWQDSDHVYRTMFRFKPTEEGYYTHKKALAVDSNILVIDLDVKKPDELEYDNKYETLELAEQAAKNSSLPTPNLIVCSGHGIHMYYELDKYIPVDEWCDLANVLKSKAASVKLLCDPATFRPTQPLRVINTWNKREGRTAKQCKILHAPREAKYSVKELKTKIGLPPDAFDVLDGFDVSTLPPEIWEMDCSKDLVNGIDLSEPEYVDVETSVFKLFESCKWFRNEINTGGMLSDYEDWLKFLSVCTTLNPSYRDSVALLGSKHHASFSKEATIRKLHDSGLGGAHKCTSGIPCPHRHSCDYFHKASQKVSEPTIAYSGALYTDEEKQANAKISRVVSILRNPRHHTAPLYAVTDTGVIAWYKGSLKVQDNDEDSSSKTKTIVGSFPVAISNTPYMADKLVSARGSMLMFYQPLTDAEAKELADPAAETFRRQLNSLIIDDSALSLPIAHGVMPILCIEVIGQPLYPEAHSLAVQKMNLIWQGYTMAWVDHHKNIRGIVGSKAYDKVRDENEVRIIDGDVDGWTITSDEELVYVHGDTVVCKDGSSIDSVARTITQLQDYRGSSVYKIDRKKPSYNSYVSTGTFEGAFNGYKALFGLTNMNMQGVVLSSLAAIVRSLQEKVLLGKGSLHIPLLSIHAPSGSGKTTTVRAVSATMTSDLRGVFDGANFTESAVFETWGAHPCQLAVIDEISPEVFAKFGTGSYKRDECHAIGDAVKSLVNNSSRKRSSGNTGFSANTGDRYNTTLIAGNHKIKDFLIDPTTGKYADPAAACRVFEIEGYSITDDNYSSDYVSITLAVDRVESNAGQIIPHFAKHLLGIPKEDIKALYRKIANTALIKQVNKTCQKLEDVLCRAQKIANSGTGFTRFISGWAQLMLLTAKLCHESKSLPIAPLSDVGAWIIAVVNEQIESILAGLYLMSASNTRGKSLRQAALGSVKNYKVISVVDSKHRDSVFSNTKYKAALELDKDMLLNDTISTVLKNTLQAEVSAIHYTNPKGVTEVAVSLRAINDIAKANGVKTSEPIDKYIAENAAALHVSVNRKGVVRNKSFTFSLGTGSTSSAVLEGEFIFIENLEMFERSLLDDGIAGMEEAVTDLRVELTTLLKSAGL